ncbi:hypothetical protein Raf01_82420 [Rugosimonospora africana]|uniref:Uncharacterized protein n=2 Tax=Rugosimonospora africana TaxID=556532 RepID=A0A8J3QZ67_9ACTN|nr:hypothetical protein Raf01_82420 [Rugosimonospora africana]
MALGLWPASAAHADSAVGGPIQRSEVISRAHFWTSQYLEYDQGGQAKDPQGRLYRTDCSGFVSMALHLSSSLVTQELPSVATQISRSNLQPGDFLDYTADHVILFDHWESDHEHFWYDTFGATPPHAAEADIDDSYIDGWPNGDYVAYRYDNIRDDSNPEVGRAHAVSIAGGQLYHTVRNVDGTWTGWQPLDAGGLSGAGAATSVTDATDGSGNLQVVAVIGGTIYHRIRYTDGSWSGWGSLGPGTQVSASIDRRANVLHLAAVINGTIYHRIRWADGSWSPWASLGAGTGVWISVDQAHNVVQMLGLGVNGTTGSLYHRVRNADGTWTGWGLVDGSGSVTSAAATADDNGNLQVLEVSGGAINHRIRYSDGTWSGWGDAGNGASAVAGSVNFTWNDMQTMVVAGGTVEHRVRNADGTWTNWAVVTPPGTATAIAISVV